VSEDIKALELGDAVFGTLSLLPIPQNMERLPMITGILSNEVNFICFSMMLSH
jgi:hypothetical protein